MRAKIEQLYDEKSAQYGPDHHRLFDEFKTALNEGRVRAAEPSEESATGWRVNTWVKKGILLGFRMGVIVDMSVGELAFRDKSTYHPRRIGAEGGIRVVPGGSSIRDGCYLGASVTCMPPMFINVGAYVDENTMVDSHALIGSCAQVGKNCHISAGAQIGGVIEPVGAMPVIVEDEVMIGGNCGVYEGTVVKRRAVLGTGTILNRSTPVYDLVRDTVYTATDDEPLVVPEQAIVVPGAREVKHPAGAKWGLSLYAAVIVKYRDEKTDARVRLEEFLR